MKTNYTASLVRLRLNDKLVALRKSALERGIPVVDDETLQYLLVTVSALRPKHILEIGTAVGLSATAMLEALPETTVTTVELEEERYLEAKRNFEEFGVADRVKAYLGDAGEFLAMTDGKYDFVFLDGPKAQYEKYLFDLKRLLNENGVLFSDDILLYGWVDGKVPTPKKRQSIVDKIRNYLTVLTNDPDFRTSVLDIGDGVAVSVYTGGKE